MSRRLAAHASMVRWRWVLAAVFVLLIGGATRVLGASDDSITAPDTDGDVGLYPVVVLDGDGYPVVAYFAQSGDLKVLHCDDPNCSGGGESITSHSTNLIVPTSPSMALDGDGNPVVAYSGDASRGLTILHCDDPDCADGGESITSHEPDVQPGAFLSLALDTSGYPVVSYSDFPAGDLKILRCDDPNCAGGGESITSPDTAERVGAHSSLALDADGYPVVAYYDITNGDLKNLHCDDLNCAGGGESITSPDTAGTVGWHPSLALDVNGYPVVSYRDATNGDLKILHCDDPDCADGGESITSPDMAGDVGWHSSLTLDLDGYPVVAYYDITNGDLKILHCDDPDCADGGESIISPDTAGNVGQRPSLVLDADGYPVVAYYDVTNGDLKILHCDDPNCADNTPPTLGLPDDIVVEAAGPDGTLVEFEVIATDADDPNPVVVCDPASGSLFAPGDTMVDCTATDASGNSSTGSFTVTVESVAEFRFEDVPEGHTFDVEIHWMAEEGITFGCNPPANSRFCPGENVTRGQMAAFLARGLQLGEAPSRAFADMDGHLFERDVDRLAAADITRGCNPPANDRFCPNDEITRGQMAAFLVRALGLPAANDQGFVDTDGNTFAGDIDRLAAAGITRGCNPPDNDRFCPNESVTRGQMAAFIYRALQFDP